MRMTRVLSMIFVAALTTACARPLVVKELATVSEPMLADVQRSTRALQQRFADQRQDLALSKAATDVLRIGPARLVNLKDTIWQDLGRGAERAQLNSTRQLDAQIRTDPYAMFATGGAATVTRVASPDLAGLIDAARALERMKQDHKASLADARAFAESVQEELQKLEDEANETGE